MHGKVRDVYSLRVSVLLHFAYIYLNLTTVARLSTLRTNQKDYIPAYQARHHCQQGAHREYIDGRRLVM